MQLFLTYSNWRELLEEFKQGIGVDYQSVAFEHTLKLPATLGRGYIRSVQLQPGLTLYIQEHQFREDVVLYSAAQTPSLGLSFCLNGNVDGYLKAPDDSCNLQTGNYGLVYRPEIKGERHYRANQVIQLIQVDIAPNFLQTLVAGHSGKLPNVLQACLKQQTYLLQGVTTSRMATTLHQIWGCPYQGLMKRLYLESKVLELIAWQLDTPEQKPALKQLKGADLDCIYQAQEIIKNNLADPPSLMALARQVGLNDYKLKLGFRQVIGTTVFGYLHQCRMEQARYLLATKDITVTEVVRAVGYSNRGHFAAAFKRRYGVTPREFGKAGS
ncbi:MAG: AraC family transcriptional regulator [Cyanobacteria bacterium P01_C01_bin.118]